MLYGMETKYCHGCKRRLPVSEFHRHRGKKDGLQPRCKECKHRSFLAWYGRHKKLHRKLADRWDRRQRILLNKEVVKYLKEHPCVDCGERDVLVLTFDHRRDKQKVISHMVDRLFSWEKVLKEIEKCEVRCANCHLKRHMKERKTMRCRVLEGLV